MKNNSVKVCHFSSKHSVDDVRVFWKECRSLAAAGYEVVYIGIGDSDVLDGVTRVGVKAPSDRRERLLEIRQHVYSLAVEQDADIYHFHDPELLPYGRKLKRMGKKVIFDSHELFGDLFQVRDYIPRFARTVLSRLYLAYERSVCAELDAVVFPTTVGGVNPFAFCAAKTITVDNLSLLPDSSIEPPFDDSNKVCYIGSLTPDRGIQVLMEGCYKAGVELVLCGKIDREFHDLLKSLEAYQVVDYRGEVPFDQIGFAMRECFAGAATLPRKGQWNKVDNLPTKAYDYMLHYLPVILNDSPKAVEFVRTWRCGISVDASSSDSIAGAIESLMAAGDKGRAMGIRGHDAIMKSVNWRTEERKLLDLYASMFE